MKGEGVGGWTMSKIFDVQCFYGKIFVFLEKIFFKYL